MRNFNSTEAAKSFDRELDGQELDNVTGGGARNTTTNSTSTKKPTEGPTESLSLNFTKISFTYAQ